MTDLDGHPITAGINRPLPVKTVENPQVTIPLSDSRTGQMDVSMFEDIAPALQVATSVVKVEYVNPKGQSILVLNGIVLGKSDDFDNAVTTVQLHDSTLRLKRRYLGYNHYSIMLGWATEVSDGDVNALTGGDFNGITSIYGIPLDGTGIRLLLLDTSHGAKDWRGWPPLTSSPFFGVPAMGIRYDPDNSTDTANRQPVYGAEGIPPTGFPFHGTLTAGSATITGVTFPGGQTITDVYEYGALSGPGIADFAQVLSASGTSVVMSQKATLNESLGTVVLEDALYCQLSRGDCVYDDITSMVQAQGAFECDYLAVDKDHLGFSGAAWVAGQLCELYTANRVGSDRSFGNTAGNTPVQFVHGLGGCHVTHAPDANALITYVAEVGPGGQNDPNDLLNKAIVEANTVPTYGFYEAWDQAVVAGNGDNPISNAVLNNRAEAVLTAYQNPPQFLTITIDTDSVGQYAYGTDFFLGDSVTIFAKRGNVTMGPLTVRITSVGITRIDEAGNCQLAITAVPYLTASVNPSDAGTGG